MINIQDKYGRTFKKLRVSLNDMCNFSCLYCVSEEDDRKKKAGSMKDKKHLNFNEYIRIIKNLNDILGLETIRLTGGEPMLYKELVPLVSSLKKMGIPEVAMTTNASMLGNKAYELRNAGLDGLNISMDAVDTQSAEAMTRRSQLKQVIKGISTAKKAGLSMKINAVIMKGVNDDQVLPLLKFGKNKNIPVRFLELMKMGHLFGKHSDYFYSESQILEQISQEYNFRSIERKPSATANYWETDDGYKFGIISNHSSPFCSDCNRLRLDSSGKIYGCLSNPFGTSVLEVLDDEHELRKILLKALGQKQEVGFTGSNMSMKAIGG